ncbi:ATP-binding SpoIIE family protein phosphatase [Actinomadura fibrosa]|uniref:ATP-binding protein n=1 Tax=Actinomadura fibrosa TaxID=111802 RepID=A0ABW2XDZ4_9ACTN|nr:ATP-binding SpoIIE family protein phosphatase [Actinomadura fibrosa]
MDPLTGPGWTSSPPVGDALWIRVEEESAAAGVRRRVTALAERLGFAGERLGQVRLAATEAATNLAKHARQGEMLVRIVREGEAAALEFVCVDRGPGIADVAGSRLNGFSTSGTLGIGLGSIERLADRSGLHSLPGAGTVLFARFVRADDASAADGPPFAGLTRPIDGEDECGDAYAAHVADGTVYAMLCDGLGHGPLAARAAQEAVRAVRDAVLPARPAELLERVHRRLGPTRGGAVAVAAVDPAAGTVRFAGLGNIAGWIVGGGRRQGMISVPGIAGTHAKRFREDVYPLPPGGVVVLHSDGLTDRWDAAERPGLFQRPPLLIASVLLRDAGIRHDDRSVLAVTTSGGS